MLLARPAFGRVRAMAPLHSLTSSSSAPLLRGAARRTPQSALNAPQAHTPPCCWCCSAPSHAVGSSFAPQRSNARIQRVERRAQAGVAPQEAAPTVHTGPAAAAPTHEAAASSSAAVFGLEPVISARLPPAVQSLVESYGATLREYRCASRLVLPPTHCKHWPESASGRSYCSFQCEDIST